MSKENVLVTGGAGYVGSVLTETLLENGYCVTVLDNLMFRQQSLLGLCYNERLSFVKGDARDQSLVKELVSKHDVLIPLAALVGAPICKADPHTATSVNLHSVKFLLEQASVDQKVIFPTTNSGYGIGEEGQYCDEETPLRPVSLYGRDKVEAEKAFLDQGSSVTFRFATLFGTSPRMRLDLLVNDFTYRAFKDRAIVLFESHFKRNFLHVRDATLAFLFAVENYDQMKGIPFNVGLSEANLSKMELCLEIKKQLPDFHIFESEIGEDPDKRDYIVSNDRIEKLGFKAVNGLQKGISELIKGYAILPSAGHGNV
jgi:nucleoside-diphosphate-sugar epimerase